MTEIPCPIKTLAENLGLPDCNNQCMDFLEDPNCPHTDNDTLFPKILTPEPIKEEVLIFY